MNSILMPESASCAEALNEQMKAVKAAEKREITSDLLLKALFFLMPVTL